MEFCPPSTGGQVHPRATSWPGSVYPATPCAVIQNTPHPPWFSQSPRGVRSSRQAYRSLQQPQHSPVRRNAELTT